MLTFSDFLLSQLSKMFFPNCWHNENIFLSPFCMSHSVSVYRRQIWFPFQFLLSISRFWWIRRTAVWSLMNSVQLTMSWDFNCIFITYKQFRLTWNINFSRSSLKLTRFVMVKNETLRKPATPLPHLFIYITSPSLSACSIIHARKHVDQQPKQHEKSK